MTRAALLSSLALALVCQLTAAPAHAQEAAQVPPAPSREPGRLVRTFQWAAREADASRRDGFYAKTGGLIPGSGWIAAGPGYRRRLFAGGVLDASAVMSTRRASMAATRIEWPDALSGHGTFGGEVRIQDFTQVDFFGVGAGTSASDRTNYRLRTADVLASGVLRPRRWLTAGGRAGYLYALHVRPGLGTLSPSTLQRFDDSSAPGLTAQPRYLHADVFVQVDSRDQPGYPTSGGVYRVGFSRFADLDQTGQSFRRLDADVTRFLPLVHGSSVVVLGARLTATTTGANDSVPFYLLPTLGGHGTLRGYDDYRFADRNAALVSGEYRWRIFEMMDAALFADAGTVAPTVRALGTERLHKDYGLGVRLHTTTRSLLAVDVAKGSEGMRVGVSLSTSLGDPGRHVVPYVR